MPTLSKICAAILFVLVALTLSSCSDSEPVTSGTPIAMHRLTEDQYRNIIADAFGSTISVASRFDPVMRREGLLAVGAHNIGITPAGFERFENLARAIAAQVVDDRHRAILIPCNPAQMSATNDRCIDKFYAHVSRLLFRRPLAEDEVSKYVKIATEAAKARNDFYVGLSYGLTAMLASPEFLYVMEFDERDPVDKQKRRRDAFAKATRLSFFLWNTTPDDALLIAAEKGTLHTERGLEEQVDRMIGSAKFETGVRAFFSDMLGFDAFETLSKDGIIYPAFSSKVAADAKEQTLKTIVDLLIDKRGDYRDLFKTRTTYMSPSLGPIYKVPVVKLGEWTPFEFPKDTGRSGIQSLVGFIALHSHAGKSSPTLRGKAVRELLLCQKVPDPPGDVSFEQFHNPTSPLKTAREHLLAHVFNPTCAGCHKIMDPIGLTLENFDGAGQFRTTDGGTPIDASGELDGLAFPGPDGLGESLSKSPAIPACLVDRLYTYAVGRGPASGDRELIRYLEQSFADEGYRLTGLMRRIATSSAFYALNPERPVTTAAAN